MEVRAGRRELDQDECVALWVSAVAERDGFIDAEAVGRRARAKFDQPILRFAVWGADPRGFALTVTSVTPDGEPVALLDLLAVDPRCAGQGGGRALVEDAVDCARRAGHSRLELAVRRNNQRAIRLYEESGFVPTGVSAPHPLGGEPMLTFRANLG